MSEDLLARLADCQAAMIRALDGAEAAVVEAAAEDLRAAIEAVRRAGLTPEAIDRERLSDLADQANAAQARVNFLTDRIARHVAGLAAARGVAADTTYRRSAR
jgi:hypothetical protein